MNIHPIFVHFPIALLSIYALVEIIPMRRFLPAIPWDAIRDFLLYAGTLFMFPTIVTGMIAGQIMGETPAVEVHEQAALTTAFIFFITALLSRFWRGSDVPDAWKGGVFKVFALLGFIGLLVTGALGAAMVYGTGNDPIVSFITWIFGLR